MKKRSVAEEFAALLDGTASDASSEVEGLGMLASALTPAGRTGMDPGAKARIRNELMAAATALEEEEIEQFALALDHPRAMVSEDARELVAVAAALEAPSLPTPSPAFRYQLRNQLASGAALSRREKVAAAWTTLNDRMRRSLKAVTATGVAAALIAGSSASFAASSSALPTDALYKLKRFREATVLMASSGSHKGFLYLDDARTRLDEVRGMTLRGIRDPQPYVDTLGSMDDETVRGATILIDDYRQKIVSGDVLRQIDQFARVQVADLGALVDHIPAGAQPRARDSLIVAARVALRAENVLAGCPCSSDPLVNGATDDGTAPPTCSCATGSPSLGGSTGTTGGSTGSNNNAGGPKPGPSPTPKPQPSPGGPIVLPTVPGAEQQEQTVEDLLNQLLNQVPTPNPTVPPLPVSTPTVPSVPTGVPSL